MLSILGIPGGAAAQPNTNWTEVNLAVTDAHVIPAYEAFARASAGLERREMVARQRHHGGHGGARGLSLASQKVFRRRASGG